MSTPRTLALVVAAGSALAVAKHTNAQTTCNRQIGPDVIVGSLHRGFNDTSPGPSSNNVSTTVNGVPMSAFSMGTTSCNVGNVNLLWIQNTNQHPVIGQSLYRLKTITSGAASYQTFEQLGQSWLKHGFCTLTEFECCTTCIPNGGCNSTLTPGCSDPYTASRNWQQSSLGPKWQVNAYTGVFTYPPANPPGATATPVARRLQVRTADLDTTSQFFGEGQYVSPDDASAGNQHNNVSYRPAHFTGGPTAYTMWLDSATVREKAAIQAWKTADPTVTETIFRIPNEGTVIVSSKATNIGNGFYHYEYAVYNMNSDQCVGRFSIPIADTATVQNIGFHDVDYHSGDGVGNITIDGADWSSSRSNNTLSWTTTPFSQNANGNAVRWGTAYNFRFDANVGPAASGNATIGLWKTPASTHAVAAQVPGSGGGGPPANNACSTPTVIGNGNHAFNTAGATTDGPAACGITSDVWFRFSTACAGTVSIQAITGAFVPGVAVYQGFACPPTTQIQCNTSGTGMISFTSTANTVYTIRLGTVGGSGTGSGVLALTVPVAPAITQHPQPQSVCTGGSASFSVTATGGAPLTYQWRLDGNNIAGATSPTYTIQNVQPQHVGSYTCRVTNPCNAITSNAAALTLGSPPSITQHPPAALAVGPGQQAGLQIAATGSGLSYQWRRNGQNLTNTGGYSGVTTSTLTINPFDPAQHDGRYTCQVSSGCGSATSNESVICYGNCDVSTTSPVLNVADFTCFLQRFAANEPYPNCDGSTTAPVLNVADFTCFLQRFAAGCP